MLGSAAAAMTAAYLGSRIGVVGTILGAALASVVSAVAGAAYTASLRRTRELVRGRSTRTPQESRRWHWGHVAGAAAVVFAATLGAVTGIELINGHSFDGTRGTTVGGSTPAATPSPTPTRPATPRPTVTPSPTTEPTPVTPSETPTPSATPTAVEPTASPS